MGVLRPAGPLPARVYWFRRFVVVGIPLVIVAVVVWVLLGRGDGTTPDGTAQEPGTSETPAGDGTTTDETTGPEACAVEALGLTLTADAPSYAPGALPTLTVSLVNNGTVDCLVDAGEAQREILIMSGEDRIWSTRDCAAEDTLARELLLVPGTPDVTTVQWARVRSAVGCPTDEVDAQPGTYSATLSLAGVTPPPAVFVLE